MKIKTHANPRPNPIQFCTKCGSEIEFERKDEFEYHSSSDMRDGSSGSYYTWQCPVCFVYNSMDTKYMIEDWEWMVNEKESCSTGWDIMRCS